MSKWRDAPLSLPLWPPLAWHHRQLPNQRTKFRDSRGHGIDAPTNSREYLHVFAKQNAWKVLKGQQMASFDAVLCDCEEILLLWALCEKNWKSPRRTWICGKSQLLPNDMQILICFNEVSFFKTFCGSMPHFKCPLRAPGLGNEAGKQVTKLSHGCANDSKLVLQNLGLRLRIATMPISGKYLEIWKEDLDSLDYAQRSTWRHKMKRRNGTFLGHLWDSFAVPRLPKASKAHRVGATTIFAVKALSFGLTEKAPAAPTLPPLPPLPL